MAEILRSTQSMCPVCLEVVGAKLVADGERVLLRAACLTHGDWQTPIWNGPPSFESWSGTTPSPPVRHTCTAVIEVTRRCDLGCPVCFAESSSRVEGDDPSLAELERMLHALYASEGEVNVQLSGGEPTSRADLPVVVASARDAGFSFVQLNTNGLRLSDEPGYADTLREAGLSSVFLQFDGVTDGVYQALRGRPLAAKKLRAVERCAEAGLAVVLVPTIVAGVNDGEIGDLVRFAAEWPGVVRGLHLQPVSYFGRYPRDGRPRLTLPDLLRALERQTGGEVAAADFAPSCCEHPRCSFRARYWVRDGGRLEPLRAASSCCSSPGRGEPARRAVAATSRQWSRSASVTRESGDAEDRGATGPARPEPTRTDTAPPDRTAPDPTAPDPARTDSTAPGPTERAPDELDRLLQDADRILAISGMLFQDAWSIDLERVGRCCVQVVTGEPDHGEGGLVPFCLWNLTSESGRRLYPRR